MYHNNNNRLSAKQMQKIMPQMSPKLYGQIKDYKGKKVKKRKRK